MVPAGKTMPEAVGRGIGVGAGLPLAISMMGSVMINDAEC